MAMSARSYLLAAGGLSAALTLSCVSPASATTQYIYDAAGRLYKVVASNGKTVTYTYDAAGNRISITVT